MSDIQIDSIFEMNLNKSFLSSYFLDGAHTKESIEICSEWFKSQTNKSDSQNFLIYNSIGDRDSGKMLNILHPINFEKVFFTTNAPTKIASKNKKDGE